MCSSTGPSCWERVAGRWPVRGRLAVVVARWLLLGGRWLLVGWRRAGVVQLAGGSDTKPSDSSLSESVGGRAEAEDTEAERETWLPLLLDEEEDAGPDVTTGALKGTMGPDTAGAAEAENSLSSAGGLETLSLSQVKTRANQGISTHRSTTFSKRWCGWPEEPCAI